MHKVILNIVPKQSKEVVHLLWIIRHIDWHTFTNMIPCFLIDHFTHYTRILSLWEKLHILWTVHCDIYTYVQKWRHWWWTNICSKHVEDNLVNKANLVHYFSSYIYYFSVHVSGDYVPIIRRQLYLCDTWYLLFCMDDCMVCIPDNYPYRT